MDVSLFSDEESVCAAVRVSCRHPHTLKIFALDGLLTEDHAVSAYGDFAIGESLSTDAILVDWSLDKAASINALYQALRHRNATIPVIAICKGDQKDMIAALATGADDVISFPLFLPLLQARIVAHYRLTEAVRHSTLRNMRRKFDTRQSTAPGLSESKTEEGESLEGFIAPKGLQVSLRPIQDISEIIEQLTSKVEFETAMSVDEFVEDRSNELADTLESPQGTVSTSHQINQVGVLRLDRTAHRFHIRNKEITLTPKEFALLDFLMENANTLCTRDEILNNVWGIDFETGTNMVDVYMHFLRKKLAHHGLGKIFQTIRGRGYRLSIAGAQAS